MTNRILLLLFLFVSIDISAQNLNLITTLEQGLVESSGLININGRIITHTDSGGKNALFEIDTLTGSIARTVFITNTINSDWEDICNDDTHIFIGDFGNNGGNRTSLIVYKISIADFLNTTNDSITADSIQFSYAEQTDFTFSNNNTNFDSEAIISYDSLLYIFSKNWVDSKCNIYALSKTPGVYSIAKVDSFDSEGLITGACYNEASNSIVLTGYGPPIPFVVRILDITSLPFSTNYRIQNFIQVPNGTSVQIEAICPLDDENYYVSSEQSALGDAMLSKLNVNELLPIKDLPQNSRTVSPNPSIGSITIMLKTNETVKIYDSNGSLKLESNKSLIPTNYFPSGMYLAVIFSEDHIPIAKANFIVQ